MITAKDALKNALESEYVKNWLEEANREIVEASVAGRSNISKKVEGRSAWLIIRRLNSLGYRAEFNTFWGRVEIEWM